MNNRSNESIIKLDQPSDVLTELFIKSAKQMLIPTNKT